MEQRKIERRRKAILNIFLTHIEDGELRLLETIKTIDIYGRPVQFNVVRMQHFLDPITESFEEHTLSCKMLDGQMYVLLDFASFH